MHALDLQCSFEICTLLWHICLLPLHHVLPAMLDGLCLLLCTMEPFHMHGAFSYASVNCASLRYDGVLLSVPNKKLMGIDIQNVTESKRLQDRIQFEVDADSVTPEAMADLSATVHEMVCDEYVRHLFDTDFVPYAAMIEVRDPLKYQARIQPSSFACFTCIAAHSVRCTVAWHCARALLLRLGCRLECCEF